MMVIHMFLSSVKEKQKRAAQENSNVPTVISDLNWLDVSVNTCATRKHQRFQLWSLVKFRKPVEVLLILLEVF